MGDEKYWEAEWGGKAIFSHGTQASRGVAIFFSKQMFSLVQNIKSLEDGRTIIFDLVVSDYTVTFVTIYAPNEDKPEYFRGIERLLRERSEHKSLNWRL